MEAAAYSQRHGDGGQSKDDAHDLILYWHYHSIGAQNLAHLIVIRLVKG
jgi:hypothetical protein